MSFLLMIFGILSTIGLLIWRIKAAAFAAREISNVAGNVINMPRRLAFKRKADQSGKTVIDDPREAATILMLEVARGTGELTGTHFEIVRSQIHEHFELSLTDSEDMIAHVDWVSSEHTGHKGMQNGLIDLIISRVSQRDLIDLDGMLVLVSEAEGLPNRQQLELLQRFRQKTGIVA